MGLLKGEWEVNDDAVFPSAAGCSRTHSAVTLGDWSDPLDPDAETQMVYRQLLLGRDRLRWVLPTTQPTSLCPAGAATHCALPTSTCSFFPCASDELPGAQAPGEDGEASSGGP